MTTIAEIRSYAESIKTAGETVKEQCSVVAKQMAAILESALQFPKGDLHVDVYRKEDHAFMAQFSTKVEHVVYNVNGSFTLVGDPASPVVSTMSVAGHEPFAVNDAKRLVEAFTDNLLRQVKASATFKIEEPRPEHGPKDARGEVAPRPG